MESVEMASLSQLIHFHAASPDEKQHLSHRRSALIEEMFITAVGQIDTIGIDDPADENALDKLINILRSMNSMTFTEKAYAYFKAYDALDAVLENQRKRHRRGRAKKLSMRSFFFRSSKPTITSTF